MSGPWYQNGLRFQCTQCGRCCSGEPGYVWVREEDITRIAAEIGLSRPQFESTFVRTVRGMGKSLREFENGDCCLLDEEKRTCRVYQSRPVQCRTWPFWKRNIESPGDWAQAAKSCPGINRGPLFPLEEIENEEGKIEI